MPLPFPPPLSHLFRFRSPVSALGLALVACALVAMAGSAVSAEAIHDVTATVRFSPNGGCSDAIVAAIAEAKTQIRVQAYSFTSAPIGKALVAAKQRGVDVAVIVDKSQNNERYTAADFVSHAGIPVVVDITPAIAHSKVIIIDSVTVVTGSYNFSSAAETKNVENLLVLNSIPLAAAYLGNWRDRQAVSVPFVPRDQK